MKGPLTRNRLLTSVGGLLAATALPRPAGAATSLQKRPSPVHEAAAMPVVKHSLHPFSETTQRLLTSIEQAGNTVFATIDQSAAAAQVGLTLRPTSLIVFGNPKAGTLLMDAFPIVGLDLPLKLLVWEDGGGVSVAYTPMSELAARYNISGRESLIAAVDSALATLSDSVSQR